MSAASAAAATEPRSYYGQPVIKKPVWTPEIPSYLFMGGLGGASATFAYLCERGASPGLARRAWATALGAVSVGPPLLISDLGKPSRFLNMLRMFKVTSPMSVGSWVLATGGLATGVSAMSALTGRLRGPARVAKPAAAALGLPLSTYTGALLSQTAVPAWHEARRELPALFAAGAAVSAGAAATVLAPPEEAAPARRLALLGAAAELLAVQVMERRLGDLAEAYRSGAAETYSRAARGLTVAGALVLAARGRRRREAAVAGGAMLLAGAASERWSVFKAGFQSAADPRQTVGPQRRRIRSGLRRGASVRGAERPQGA